MLSGAILGVLGALIAIFIVNKIRKGKYEKLLKAAQAEGATAALPVYKAEGSRFKKSAKMYDSFGVAYIIGKKMFYLSEPGATPETFDLEGAAIEFEGKWRNTNWVSISNPVVGTKTYFTSFIQKGFSVDSSATNSLLNQLKAAQG